MAISRPNFSVLNKDITRHRARANAVAGIRKRWILRENADCQQSMNSVWHHWRLIAVFMYPPFGNRRWYPPRLYQLMLLEPEKFQVFSQRQLESVRYNFSHLCWPPLECNSERSENSNVRCLLVLIAWYHFGSFYIISDLYR